ncbi:hypothetical protein B0H13DRAFT_1927088 [Mycena leptocephala]|nr:hypothetical protein B0H13DRAFT_1927088 [Mycena leptocephala]
MAELDSLPDHGNHESEAERHRRLRREVQRLRRVNETESDRDSRRRQNTTVRRLSRSVLSEDRITDIRREKTDARRANRTLLDNSRRAEIRREDAAAHTLSRSERIHDQCFVCGPKGNHYQPPLPPYPEEWEYFILDRKTTSISRKLNNIFSLTAIGGYDGDFMKFPVGIAAVTIAGGRTYRRMLPAHEAQHAIRWFIQDPWGMVGTRHPFIAELEKLNVYDDEDDIALHIEHADSATNEIAAIISLAPICSLPPQIGDQAERR